MIRISVTEEHIREGKPKDGACCPIAIAIKEQERFRNSEVHVGLREGVIHGGDGKRTFLIGPDGQNWIRQYDGRGGAGPAEFEFAEWPGESLKPQG